MQGVLVALAATGANVIDQTIHGLTVGALDPDQPSMNNTESADNPEDEASEL